MGHPIAAARALEGSLCATAGGRGGEGGAEHPRPRLAQALEAAELRAITRWSGGGGGGGRADRLQGWFWEVSDLPL